VGGALACTETALACVVWVATAVVVVLAGELDDLLLLPQAVPTMATNPAMTAHLVNTRRMFFLPSPTAES